MINNMSLCFGLIGFKGQSAIEYLTTYGWMLLVVVVSGTAIYSTVDTGCQVEVQNPPTADLTIEESGISNGEKLSVVFRNSASQLVKIRSTELDGRRKDNEKEIPTGEDETYDIADVTTATSCNEYELSVVYDSGALKDLEQTFTVKGPFELAKIIAEKLLTSGDQIDLIETKESVMPINNTTMCFGGDCNQTDGGNLSGTEKYVNISGDSMQGTLDTNDFNADCYGDLCNNTKTNDNGYVNTENNTMEGTLNITEIKPISNLCLGGTCS